MSQPSFPLPSTTHRRQLTLPVLFISASFSIQSDRLVPELDTIVPLESTKAYDMVDIIYSVSAASACLVCVSSAMSMVIVLWPSEEVLNPQALKSSSTGRAWDRPGPETTE